MTRREIGFLLIGLGFGLLLALAAVLEVLLSLYRSAFIAEYGWDRVFVLVPVVLLITGLTLVLRRPKPQADFR